MYLPHDALRCGVKSLLFAAYSRVNRALFFGIAFVKLVYVCSNANDELFLLPMADAPQSLKINFVEMPALIAGAYQF